MLEWDNLLIIAVLVLAVALFASAIYALFWASKNGQLENFDKNAKSIFTEEEPEGEVIDTFPSRKSAVEKSSKR
tara:strand:- start:12458 stop:12679 length:222 start_codon:yes stop_codon:yes gene_type:complete